MYILTIDQGTSSCRAIIFDQNAQIVSIGQKEYTQIFPEDGWVEHDAMEIWETQMEVVDIAVEEAGIRIDDIKAVSITNQRETVLLWNKETGQPIANAIVWQDRRTAPYCNQLIENGHKASVQEKTGLVIDAYFSGTKVKWLLDHVDGARALASEGKLLMGTIDTWLIWKMTNGANHVTDPSNASRTLLYNINDGKWDDDLCNLMNIPKSILPEVKANDEEFGVFHYQGHDLVIHSVLGDQQAALFGQQCIEVGQAKNTYGTGCFMLMNIGNQNKLSKNNLLSTIAWKRNGQTIYAFEGSVFMAGASVQWLRDSLEIIAHVDQLNMAIKTANPKSQVVVVPAFVGLGAPHWDSNARGAIFGMVRDSGKNEIIKATIESIAFQVFDLVKAMEEDAGVEIKEIRVDGGASRNDFLMQFQADLTQTAIARAKQSESTALGTAMMAGLNCGLWKEEDLAKLNTIIRVFYSQMDEELRQRKISTWNKAVERTLNWID